MRASVRVPKEAPVRAEGKRFWVDGRPVAVYSGAVHYWRLDRDKWSDILDKVIGMGFNAITSYIPWEAHELKRGEFDFGRTNPSNDIDAFLTLCEKKGLYVIVRPGPQINSEMTWFGYPLRILEDPELQARTSQGALAVLTQAPRPIPALSYMADKFFAETALWYDAICAILAKHVHPKGNLVAVQVDNEMAYFFHINPYQCDYSDASIAAYRKFLHEKYGTIAALNEVYRTSYPGFETLDPPRRFEAKTSTDIPYHVDWIEYREDYLVDSLTRLAQMMRDRGIVGIPLFHNYPHPLGPGGSASGITTPFNLGRLEEKLDFVGFDIYSRRELYDHVKTVVSYVVGTSRYPFIPEFVAGVWPWYLRPGTEVDEAFVTKAAVMHGIKGSSRYMIVERNRWFASPVMRDGTVRPERFEVFRKANEVLQKTDLVGMDRRADVLLLANRTYDRLEAASVLVSFPGDFFEPILGFSEYPNFMTTSEATLGFRKPIQQAKSDWFRGMYSALTETGYAFLLSDSSHPVDGLAKYRAVVVSAFEYMDAPTQRALLETAERGTHVVLGPEIPELDETMRKSAILGAALGAAKKTALKADGVVVGETYAIGKGRITHLVAPTDDVANLAKALVAVLGPEPLRVRKSEPRVDVALHSGPDAARAVMFVANPTDRDLAVDLELDRKILAGQELWSGEAAAVKAGVLSDRLPAYTIRAYEIEFAR